MFYRKQCVFWMICLLLVSSLSICFADVDEPAKDISRAGVGARPLAMGRAFTGLASDTNAMLYNPAGLAYISSIQALNINSQLLHDVNYATYLVAWPTDLGTFGFGYISAEVSNIYIGEWTDPAHTDMRVLSNGSYVNAVSILSYAKAIDRSLSWGMNLKSFSNDFSNLGINDAQAKGNNLDLGLLKKFSPEWQAGLYYQNVNTAKTLEWGTGEREMLESYVRLGLAYKAKEMFFFHRFYWLLDIETPVANAQHLPGLHTGVEGWLGDVFAIRLGMGSREVADQGRMTNLTELSGGLGLNLWGVEVDYTYYPGAVDLGDRAERYFLSLAYQLPEDEEPAKKPVLFKAELEPEAPWNGELVIKEVPVQKNGPDPQRFEIEKMVLHKNIVEVRDILGNTEYDRERTYFEYKGRKVQQVRFFPGETWLTYTKGGRAKPRLVRILVMVDHADLNPAEQGYEEIQALTYAGVFNGYYGQQGLFKPKEPLERSELEAAIARMRTGERAADLAPSRENKYVTRLEAVNLVAEAFGESKERLVKIFPEKLAQDINMDSDGGIMTRAEMAQLLARTNKASELITRLSVEYSVSLGSTYLSADF